MQASASQPPDPYCITSYFFLQVGCCVSLHPLGGAEPRACSTETAYIESLYLPWNQQHLAAKMCCIHSQSMPAVFTLSATFFFCSSALQLGLFFHFCRAVRIWGGSIRENEFLICWLACLDVAISLRVMRPTSSDARLIVGGGWMLSCKPLYFAFS